MSTIVCPHCTGHIPRNTTEEKFWTQVDKNGPIPPHVPHLGQCWEWVGSVHHHGYGIFRTSVIYGEKKKYAHRISYELVYGVIAPKGYNVCHRCDNRKCVRPDHLFLGTNEENTRDRVEKGRTLRGEATSKAKLKEEQVRLIKTLYEKGITTHRELAEKFGVSRHAIAAIVQGKRWKHVI